MTTGDDLRRGYQSGVSNSPDTAGVFVGTVTRIVSPDELYVRVPRLTGVFENRVRSSITDVQVNDQVFVALLEGRRDDFVVVGKVAPGSVLPTGEPTGFVNRTDSTISFTTATRTFTITPVGSRFDVWVGGIKFPKTVAESVVIPNTSGIHYIYYDTAGVLTAKMTYFDLSVDAPVSYIYWNATDSTQYYFADERHGFTMDWATHEYLHRTRGAAFASGFTLTGYSTVGNGSVNSHAQVSLDNGTFFDEDIEIAVTHSASPVSNTWEQRIQSNGYFPVFYRSGTAWKRDVATQYPLKFTALATYNLNTAGSWSAQAISSNKFGVYWLVATSNLNEPVMSVMGQNEYNTVGEAEATQWSSMDLTGLPIYEFRTLYRLIFQTATGYANSVKSRLVSVTDMRTTGSGVSGSPVPSGDHGSLTGLGDDDHTQYYDQTRGDARYLQLTSNLPAAQLTGTINTARLSGAYTGITGLGTIAGTLTAGTFSGSGASLTNLPAASLTGTIETARISGSYTGITGIGTITNTPTFTATGTMPVSGTSGAFQVLNNTAGNDAFMTLHVGSDFAGYFGMGGAENDLVVGGWSYGSGTRYRVYHSGNTSLWSSLSPTFNGLTVNTTTTINANVNSGGTSAQAGFFAYDRNTPYTTHVGLYCTSTVGRIYHSGYGNIASFNSNSWTFPVISEFSLAGTPTGDGAGVIRATSDGSRTGITIKSASGSAAQDFFMAFYDTANGSSAVGSIFSPASTATTTYSTTSDYRLKRDDVPLVGSLERVMALRPISYRWKRFAESPVEEGFFAHEVQEIVPCAAFGEKDAVDDGGNIAAQQIDLARLVPVLVGAVQELAKRVGDLETRI